MNVIKIKDYGPVSKTSIYGFDESVRRAKFPLSTEVSELTSTLTKGITGLAQSEPGSGHDQWLTGIIVQFDLTFTIKAWTEAERYHFFDFVSSQSTMHRIARFTNKDRYSSYTDPRIIEIMDELIEDYNKTPENSPERADKYLKILYSNPCGMYLTAGMTTNYRQLKTIYRQRKNHRLPEWREFCKWIEHLPHSELITSKI